MVWFVSFVHGLMRNKMTAGNGRDAAVWMMPVCIFCLLWMHILPAQYAYHACPKTPKVHIMHIMHVTGV